MRPGDPSWERSADNWADLQEAALANRHVDDEIMREFDPTVADGLEHEPGWITPPFPDPLGPRDIRELVLDLYPIWRTLGVAVALCILAAVAGVLTG